jgi:hypothetical protein
MIVLVISGVLPDREPAARRNARSVRVGIWQAGVVDRLHAAELE